MQLLQTSNFPIHNVEWGVSVGYVHVTNSYFSVHMSDEEAQRYLQQFSQEFSQMVQQVHAIETNYTHLKERLRLTAQRIDSAKTKLAEKRLEQMNDDLAYAKQKHELKATLATSPER